LQIEFDAIFHDLEFEKLENSKLKKVISDLLKYKRQDETEHKIKEQEEIITSLREELEEMLLSERKMRADLESSKELASRTISDLQIKYSNLKSIFRSIQSLFEEERNLALSRQRDMQKLKNLMSESAAQLEHVHELRDMVNVASSLLGGSEDYELKNSSFNRSKIEKIKTYILQSILDLQSEVLACKKSI
jgi:septal ring factor EnvC (AmiA/AmiB activator)